MDVSIFEQEAPSEDDVKLLHSVRGALESTIKTRGSQFFSPKPAHGLSGLVNQGATCYLNSIVQALFHFPAFRKRVYDWRHDPEASQSGPDLSGIPLQLQALFAGMQLSRAPAQTTNGLTEAFGWGGADAFKQHDVQELLHMLLEAMEDSYAKTKRRLSNAPRGAAGAQSSPISCPDGTASDLPASPGIPVPIPSESSVEDGEQVAIQAAKSSAVTAEAYSRPHLVWDLMQGYAADHIACTHKGCGYRRSTRQPFIDLELPVSGIPNLMESLRSAGTSDTIDGWHCDSCGEKRTALKGMSLVGLPSMLCMHLKRFVYDLNVMRRVKLQQAFHFPEVIDMGSTLTHDETRKSSGMTGGDGEPEISGEAGLTTSESLRGAGPGHKSGIYRLYAVLIHVGSAGGGHYYMYVCPGAASGDRLPQGTWEGVEGDSAAPRVWKAESDPARRIGEWFECNDAHVKPLEGPNLAALLASMDVSGSVLHASGGDDTAEAAAKSPVAPVRAQEEEGVLVAEQAHTETKEKLGTEKTPSEKPEQTGGPAGNAYLLLYVRCKQGVDQDGIPASKDESISRGIASCKVTLEYPEPPAPVAAAITGFNEVYGKLLRANHVRRAIATVRIRGPASQRGGEKISTEGIAEGGSESPAVRSPDEQLLETCLASDLTSGPKDAASGDEVGSKSTVSLAVGQCDIWRGSTLAAATRQALESIANTMSEPIPKTCGRSEHAVLREQVAQALEAANEDVSDINDAVSLKRMLLSLLPDSHTHTQADPLSWRVRLRRYNSAAGVPQEPLLSVAERELDRLRERLTTMSHVAVAADPGKGAQTMAALTQSRVGSLPNSPMECPLSWCGVSGVTDLHLEIRPADRMWIPYSRDDIALRFVTYRAEIDPALAVLASTEAGAELGARETERLEASRSQDAAPVSLEDTLQAMPQVGVKIDGSGACLGDLERLLDALASGAGKLRAPGVGVDRSARRVWLLDGDVLVRLEGDSKCDLRRDFGVYSGCTVVLEDVDSGGIGADPTLRSFKDRFDAERASIDVSFNMPADPAVVAAAGGEDGLDAPEYKHSVMVRRTDTVRSLKEAVGRSLRLDPDDFYLRRSVRGAVIKDLEHIVGDPVDVLKRQNQAAGEIGGKRREGLCLVDRSVVHVCFGAQMAADEYRTRIFLLGMSVDEWKRVHAPNAELPRELAAAGANPMDTVDLPDLEDSGSPGTKAIEPGPAPKRQPGSKPVLRGGTKRGKANVQRLHRLCELPAKSTAPVLQLKRKICAALESRGISVPPTRIRLREKKQREGPGKILRDSRPLKSETARLEDGIEFCVQLLAEAEEVGPRDMIVTLQRWKPLESKLTPPLEVIVPKRMPIMELKRLAARKLHLTVRGPVLSPDSAGASSETASVASTSCGGVGATAEAADTSKGLEEEDGAAIWTGVGLAKVAGYGPKPSGRTAHELKWLDPDRCAHADPIMAALGLRDGLTVMVRSQVEYSEWMAAGGPAKIAASRGKPSGGATAQRKPWESGPRRGAGTTGGGHRESGVRIRASRPGATNAPLVVWHCQACTFENKSREGEAKVCSMCTTVNDT